MGTKITHEKHIDLNTLIDQSIDALGKRDALALRTLSTDAISEAAFEGHRALILLGLVDYSLSKILSKVHYSDVEEKFYIKIKKLLLAAKAGPKEKTIKNLHEVADMIIALDTKEGNYEDNVMDKAKIKKAAKLYGQGLSLRRASELTGADPVQVINYIGGSKIHEFKGGGRNADRLKVARGIFE